jgi:membrane protein implicated in regulation of membrane protease activity
VPTIDLLLFCFAISTALVSGTYLVIQLRRGDPHYLRSGAGLGVAGYTWALLLDQGWLAALGVLLVLLAVAVAGRPPRARRTQETRPAA